MLYIGCLRVGKGKMGGKYRRLGSGEGYYIGENIGDWDGERRRGVETSVIGMGRGGEG